MFLYSTVSTLKPRIAGAVSARWTRGVAKLTDCGNGGDDLAELQLVEDGGLTGGVEANLLFTGSL